MINIDTWFKHLKTQSEMIVCEFRGAVDYFNIYLNLKQ